MPDRTYDAVLCDVDGCLSPETPGPTDLIRLSEVAAYNRRAREIGNVPAVTLCTGRPLPFAEAVARAVDAFDLPVVCEGGAFLLTMDPYRWELDPAIPEERLEQARELRAWVGATFDGVFFEEGKAAVVTVFDERGPEHLRDEIVPAIEAEIARRGWAFRVPMTWTCANIEPEGVSKATGIDRLVEKTGLSRDRLAGIGDTMSDVHIRERVAFFACPSNADERLKAMADYVSPEPEAAGVLDILGRL